MKKLISITVIIGMLSGCATYTPAYVLQKRSNRESIEKIRNVEIFYHADSGYSVSDLGGSALTGMAGLLGPVGALIAVGAEAGSKLSMAERAESRTKEFTKAVRGSAPDQDLNTQFANKLADLLRQDGRTVKLTQIERPMGDGRLSMSTIKDMKLSEGFVPLILRITTGYGAESATSSYRPTIVTEYVLKNDTGQVLVENKEIRNEGEKSYLTYRELLADHRDAREALRKELMPLATLAYKKMFDLSELGGK